VLETLVRRAESAAAAAGVALEAVAPPELAVPSRGANLAGLVLANLVANAVEASPNGSRVTVRALPEDGMVAFRVEDRGGGLPPEVRASLFEPVASSKPRGTGVGLAISRRLARHAGGDVVVERTGPEGTVFRVVVPAWRESFPV
jgi:signal transduction histidine kinase